MKEAEFLRRALGAPDSPGEDVLEAARDPRRGRVLERVRALDRGIAAALDGIPAPEGLRERLLAVPDSLRAAAPAADDGGAARAPWLGYAAAAALALAVGVPLALNLAPAPADGAVALGDGVLRHLHREMAEIAAAGGVADGAAADPDTVLRVMARLDPDLRLADGWARALPVHFARNCPILPAHGSAHLMVAGNRGDVSVLFIDAPPVQAEYGIRDGRFEGVVIPAERGNVVIVGEHAENLGAIRRHVVQHASWTIRGAAAAAAGQN